MINQKIKAEFTYDSELEIVKVLNNEDESKTVFTKWWSPITMSEEFYNKFLETNELIIKTKNWENRVTENILDTSNEEVWHHLGLELAKIRFDYEEEKYWPFSRVYKEKLAPNINQLSRDFILVVYFLFPEVEKENLVPGSIQITGQITLQSQMVNAFKKAESKEIDSKTNWLKRQLTKFLNSRVIELRKGNEVDKNFTNHIIDEKRILEFKFVSNEEYKILINENN